jgi:hypothetical protein
MAGMTAKQELLQLVREMDEREARIALAEWQTRRSPAGSSPPSLRELARMSPEERRPYLAERPAGIEYDEFLEWDRAMSADGLEDE